MVVWSELSLPPLRRGADKIKSQLEIKVQILLNLTSCVSSTVCPATMSSMSSIIDANLSGPDRFIHLSTSGGHNPPIQSWPVSPIPRLSESIKSCGNFSGIDRVSFIILVIWSSRRNLPRCLAFLGLGIKVFFLGCPRLPSGFCLETPFNEKCF